MKRKIKLSDYLFGLICLGILGLIFSFLLQVKDNGSVSNQPCVDNKAVGDNSYENIIHDNDLEPKNAQQNVENDFAGEEYNKVTNGEQKHLTQKEIEQQWKEVLSRPTENEIGDVQVNSWSCIGPYGMRVGQESDYYSGRILGIEVEGVPSTRIGSASGGLWGYDIIFPIAMTEGLTSQVIGAFATSPVDPNKIIVGTGEPVGTGGPGMGIFKTTDGGISWTAKSISPVPGSFYKIKYQTGIDGIIHTAANTGYYRSDNGGESWTLRFSGLITDLKFSPAHPQIMYLSKWADGIYKSINGGTNWFKLTSFPPTPDSIGTAKISVSASNDDYVYVSVSSVTGSIVGIFRSSNQGINWYDISYRDAGGALIDYFRNGIGAQGNYDNCIGVSPTNPVLVLAGGVTLIKTTDGGVSWHEVTQIAHTDHHVIRWHSDGVRVWEGNDGGMFYSEDYGETFTSNSNTLPITQFYDFDIGVSGTNITVAGGTQDNSFPVSTNCTVRNSGLWFKRLGADANDSKVDRYNPQRIMGVTYNAGNWLSKTTDGGVTWTDGMAGLNNLVRISNIEDDHSYPVYCYVGHGNKVCISTNFGDSWSQFTSYYFAPNVTVWKVGVSRFGVGANIIYAVINNGSDYLRVYDSGTWYNRSAGLPANLAFVAQHPNNNYIAYAITNGIESAQKILKTTNRGVNWVNITGDLPNISMTDLVVHPTNDNIMFAGSQYAVWKTTNGGINWYRWINGMPIANQIVRLKVIDSTSSTGRFYVVAASHGRSVWIREGSGDDLTGIHNISGNIPNKYELHQNYPNPFNPSTKIKFEILNRELTKITVFDILGRKVATLVNEELSAGSHEIEFDAVGYASGIYFYKIEAGDFTDVKKMVLVK